MNAAVSWGDIDGKPATFAPSAHTHAWRDLTGIPATFPPEAHTHSATDVAGAVAEAIATATHTQVAADTGKWKRTTSASAVTITIDANVNAAGDEITFQQGAAGQITFAAGAGLTLTTSGSIICAILGLATRRLLEPLMQFASSLPSMRTAARKCGTVIPPI